MSRITAAALARHGTALALELDDGARRLVRRVDLEAALGAASAAAPRFASVTVTDGGLEVTLTDGTTEPLDLAALGLDHALPNLVVTGTSQLITIAGDVDEPLGAIPGGAIICGGGRVLWIGHQDEVDRAGFDLGDAQRIDVRGRMVTPGLIDCHAHPIFCGNRAREFGQRAAGASYLDIAAAGGGIRATLEPTRAAELDELIRLAGERIHRALSHGTTTCEAKSGYDLTAEGELRLLEVAQALDALQPVDLAPTLLAAHVVPPEYAGDRAAYIEVCTELSARAAERQLAGAVDVYCDEGAFTLDEARAILTAGKSHGLRVRAHVGQFADLGAAELVAELGGASVDHLEQVSPAGIAALAAAGVVAVMLPGACVQLRMQPPPVEALRAAGVALAVATDMNPGTTLAEPLPLQMWLATTHYGMTVDEAWLGVTRHAARVLGADDIGILAVGARADLIAWDAETPAEIPYHYGANLAHTVWKNGRPT
ncbi:MAG TPA: imidazolonepropionase [Kofleriaceae bacterium]|nr:imidazolonepropionase [Kofleriaceae bacterium]